MVCRLIAYFLLAGIIGITLLSLTRYVGWNLLLELASHFQRQYLMASLCLLALLVLTRQKKLLLVGLFCLAIILIEILPWYMPQAKAAEVKEGNLRILSSNLYPPNKSYAKVLALVREAKPDVAVFMEVTNSWLKQLDTLSDILPYSTSETLPYLGMVIRKIPLALFWLIAIPIDHCLISPELTVTGIWTGPNVGSDHLPLITDLAIAADHKP